jgi:HD superfamily phosphodiesterase
MIILPQKFEEILNKDSSNYYKGAVYTTCHKFDEIFSENRLYFFEEYTDHGIRHIKSVLEACERLITPETYKLLSEKDISILILSVFLHDLGMHL